MTQHTFKKTTKGYKVTDKEHASIRGYHGSVYFRQNKLKKELSRCKWIWLTLVELIVGAELIESIVTTGSVTPHDNIKKSDSYQYGEELNLSEHIPAGFITNLLRSQIIELLYYKYYLQYQLLCAVGNPDINHQNKTINCGSTRFRARKEVFYQLIALRRVYDFFWLILNLGIDILVYYVSNSIEWALATAMLIEAIRRLLKV